MKKYLIVISLIFSIIGFGVKMTYDAFTLLKNEVKVMKNREASIKKKIKDRKKD